MVFISNWVHTYRNAHRKRSIGAQIIDQILVQILEHLKESLISTYRTHIHEASKESTYAKAHIQKHI